MRFKAKAFVGSDERTTNSISLEIDCQGAILRILDKTTNEKTFFTVPLSQTIELKNSNIVVHKCIKVEREGKNEEIALISHNQFGAIDSETKFFGWIFKSSQYINSPNNPSGAVCKNLEELATVAKKYKILILSDEIYTDLTFTGEYNSISKFYPELTFITGGLSKWCGAGGWRLGFLAVPKKLTEFLKSLKSLASESYSTVNTPTQYASVEAYAYEHDLYKLKVRAILKAVGNYVYNNLKSNKILIAPPQGAFYLMPEFKNKKYKTSSKLCEAILNETGVAMLPGSDFGFSPKKMLTRLSYTDFDGIEFFKNVTNCKMIDDEMIKKYAPNVVEGVSKLSNWAKNL